MTTIGLEAIYKRPRTSQPPPQYPVYTYLLRKVQIDQPNQVWRADITFVPVRKGFLYLIRIIDRATRKVLRWRLSKTMQAAIYHVEPLVTKDWMKLYNTERPHSALDRQTPDDSNYADLGDQKAA